MKNTDNNPQEVPQVKSGMKNEPQVIYLNCYDEDETDELYLPTDNDFDTLDGESVLWSADTPCLGGNIKYIHHSTLEDAESRISELEAALQKILNWPDTPEFIGVIAHQALNHKDNE